VAVYNTSSKPVLSATRGRSDRHGSNYLMWLSDLFFTLPLLTVYQYCNLNHILRT